MGGWSNRPERGAVSERSVEACCGEFGSKGCRCLVVQGRMRPVDVVVVDPRGDNTPRLVDAKEQRLIQKLVPHLAIETLDIAVLHGFAGSDVVPVDLVVPGPS